MKRVILAIYLCLGLLPAFGKESSDQTILLRGDTLERPARTIDIEAIDVIGHRPMKKIGTQETQITYRVLHDNIASQMADALKFGSSVFVKEYGRATLSTVSFRGTSPSHTQVTWNGMKLNSPMLGMVDFSMIPSYFIDDASLLHGTSSVNLTGGGLGGAVMLSTKPADTQGFNMQYVQGIGMYKTFDEFLRLTYGDDHWQVSTRAVYSSSANDFKYRNYKKKELITDENHNIIGTYYPIERNKSGDFNDFHLLQEAYYNTGKGSRFGLSAWYLNSRRGVPMLNVDYKNDSEYTNEQRDQTFRGVLSWDLVRKDFKVGAKAGYTYTNLKYDYSRDIGNGEMNKMIESRSKVNTLYGMVDADYSIGDKWYFTGNVSLYQHTVVSKDKNIITQDNQTAVVGYDKARVEFSSFLSAKWRPIERLGLGLSLREEMYGRDWMPLIPAGFIDLVLSKRGNVIMKGSISRNYRYPTLNDQYFLPGGNPDLKKESGFTYDCGIEFTVGKKGKYTLHGEASWFDSYIDDWIIWLPSFKGFWEPRNIKKVHAYGVEVKGSLDVNLAKDWQLEMNGNFSWTPSINEGEAISQGDQAYGKQLVYVPEFSSSVTGRLSYRTWRMEYKWCHYSERFTTSSNEPDMITGRVAPYFMNDLSLEKQFFPKWADLAIKCSIMNLFDEEYESVLSRPMPGIHFEVFLDIRPKWGKRNRGIK